MLRGASSIEADFGWPGEGKRRLQKWLAMGWLLSVPLCCSVTSPPLPPWSLTLSCQWHVLLFLRRDGKQLYAQLEIIFRYREHGLVTTAACPAYEIFRKPFIQQGVPRPCGSTASLVLPDRGPTAQAGASSASFPLDTRLSCSGPEMHFIPCQRSQWGPRASAETLQNGSGMQSWSCSMCWRRRHTPLSLPPFLHHRHGFVAVQEQDPRRLAHCWTKSDAGAFYPSQIVPLTCSGS